VALVGHLLCAHVLDELPQRQRVRPLLYRAEESVWRLLVAHKPTLCHGTRAADLHTPGLRYAARLPPHTHTRTLPHSLPHTGTSMTG